MKLRLAVSALTALAIVGAPALALAQGATTAPAAKTATHKAAHHAKAKSAPAKAAKTKAAK
jgi:hypothetical protein